MNNASDLLDIKIDRGEQLTDLCAALGSVIKRERLDRKMTIVQIAHALDISAAEFYRIAQGERRIATTLSYLEALGIDIEVRVRATRRTPPPELPVSDFSL